MLYTRTRICSQTSSQTQFRVTFVWLLVNKSRLKIITNSQLGRSKKEQGYIVRLNVYNNSIWLSFSIFSFDRDFMHVIQPPHTALTCKGGELCPALSTAPWRMSSPSAARLEKLGTTILPQRASTNPASPTSSVGTPAKIWEWEIFI